MTWERPRLSEVCDIQIGRTPSRAVPRYWGAGFPWLSIADMNQGPLISETKEQITLAGAEECNCTLIPSGTVLLSFKLSVGKVGITAIPMYTNEAIAALLIHDEKRLSPKFLSKVLQAADWNGGDRAAMGSTFNKASLSEIRIPVPPIDQQRRIAAILDHADALRTKRRKALAKLGSLAQSLFLETFGDPASNPRGWPLGHVEDLVTSISDGPHVSPTYAEEGIPFLSARHISPGVVQWEDLKFISQAHAEAQWRKCRPEKGDILYTKGGTTGIAAVVNFDKPIAVWVHIALLKPDRSKVEPSWLEEMLNSQYCYRQSQRLTHGIANRDLGLKRMRKIALYIPPLSLQEEFARRKSALGRMHEYQDRALKGQVSLFSSLQHRAFRGEL